MKKSEPCFEDLSSVGAGIRAREISIMELVEAFLKRIERLNPLLNCYLTLNPRALDVARERQKELQQGKSRGPLHGIPYSVKDLLFTRNLPTTAGSRVFGAGISNHQNARVIDTLERSGAILLGKTHLHEFAYGVTNENAHFGAARNPWDRERMTGGSSGGSAAAVAAGLCCFSIGTDTRGSIRIPSSCCGVTGLKPTFGIVSTRGVIPLSRSLDHVGPMSRSVVDGATILSVLVSGSRRRKDYLEAVTKPIAGLRMGICSYFFENLDPEVKKAIEAAIEFFTRSGVSCHQIDISFLPEALQASGVIASTEAVAYHDRYIQQSPSGYDPAVLKRLKTGYRHSGIDYVRAQRVREKLTQEFRRVFRRIDFLLSPTLPCVAPPIGSGTVKPGTGPEKVLHSFVRLNASQNMTGVPAFSIPCGFSQAGLPIGLQLISWRLREPLLMRLGSFFQAQSDWHRRHPAISTPGGPESRS